MAPQSDSSAAPKDCSYPKNCGWMESGGCGNLLCKHLSQEGLRRAAFFLRTPKEKK